jgi:hypothetical protein
MIRQARRMAEAKRKPSNSRKQMMGFARAQPILRAQPHPAALVTRCRILACKEDRTADKRCCKMGRRTAGNSRWRWCPPYYWSPDWHGRGHDARSRLMPSTPCRERWQRRAPVLSCTTFSLLRVGLSRLDAQRAGGRSPFASCQQMGMRTDDAKRQRSGATRRAGRARALDTDNSIVAVVTGCRNASAQCTPAP